MCNCCFEVTIKTTGIPDSNLSVIYRKAGIKFTRDSIIDSYTSFKLEEHPRKYIFPTLTELEAIENYSGQINQLTVDGQKIGLWKKAPNNSSSAAHYLTYFTIDNSGKSNRDWFATYDSDDKLISIGGRDGLGENQSATSRDYYLLFGIDILKKE
jgi:hypothetical protein